MRNTPHKRVSIDEHNYKLIVLGRAIIVCWILLAVSFVVKLFGGNFFAIACEDERLRRVCEYIDSTIWYDIITFALYFIGNLLFSLAIHGKKCFTLNQFVIFVLINLVCNQIKIANSAIGLVVETTAVFILFPLLVAFMEKKLWRKTIFKSLLCFALINVFQLVSIFTRNLAAFKVLDEEFIIECILLIDYYIMLVLYYLYSMMIKIKKETKGNG